MQSDFKKNRVVGIIPARFGSSRFPGKPLAEILGKSLIRRTYENTLLCNTLDAVVVATDDKRIFDHVKEFGGQVIMTSTSCPTGSDRLIEALQQLPYFTDVEIVVNIQGDEPCVDPSLISTLVSLLDNDNSAVMSTALMKITKEEDVLNPSVVKCCFDNQGNALYFSRSMIPSNQKGVFNPNHNYFKHIGIYGYTKDFLLTYGKLPHTPLQIAEDLEQLKVLEHGYKIKTTLIDSASVSVDHPEDIKKVELFLCQQNTYS